MNPGDLKHRLVFDQLAEGVNENGFPVTEKTTYTKAWASLETLKGRSFYAAATTNLEHNREFTIRYQRKLMDDVRPKELIVMWRSIEHKIYYIENDDGLNATMTVHLRTVS